MEIKTVSIIGLGALGILFGNELAKRMPEEDLRIIADRERVERYRKNGIFLNGERCNFNFVEPQAECGPCDLLIFAVKYPGLEGAIKAVKNQVSEKTIIISMLNGISSEEIIGRTYNKDNILYCIAQGMEAVNVGSRVTYEHMGHLTVGDREPGIISEKTKAVSGFLNKNGVPCETNDNIYKKLWGKFMSNVGMNQTIPIFGTNYSCVQKAGEARNVLISAMREVIAVSQKEGVNLTEDDLIYWLKVLENLGPEGKPSLLQDLEARRKSEVDYFAGVVIALGKKHGVSTPVNQMLYDKIKEIESSF